MARYFVTYLVYLAVLARSAGWSQDGLPIPVPAWILLALFGVLLLSEQPLSRALPWYPRLYLVLQSGLVIAMLYIAPTVDIFTMLFLPLSFQAVQFLPARAGFAWIGGFSLAMVGLLFVGMEWQQWIGALLLSAGANTLMGSFAYLMARTEQARAKNQKLFGELQGAYRQLKDSAAQAQALAAAEERHRLVRELHDSLTQTLFSMNLALQAAQLSAQEEPIAVPDHLSRLQTLARSAAGEVQALTGQGPLRPPAQGGLEAALSRLAEERLAHDGLQVTLVVSGQRELPEGVQATLYRMAQEALNNITRHAGVRQAQVRLCLEGPRASLEVEDAGCGFDPKDSNRSSGFGLAGMAERAREIGWALEIESHPGQGTRIRVVEKRA